MKKVIYKYVLPEGGSARIKGWFTGIFTVGKQNNNLVMWAENNIEKYSGERWKENEKITVEITVLGTGCKYNYVGDYIGTVQMDDGLVWHVFVRDI